MYSIIFDVCPTQIRVFSFGSPSGTVLTYSTLPTGISIICILILNLGGWWEGTCVYGPDLSGEALKAPLEQVCYLRITTPDKGTNSQPYVQFQVPWQERKGFLSFPSCFSLLSQLAFP